MATAWTDHRSLDGVERLRLRARAAQRALQLLRRAHPNEYRALLAAELRRLGLEPGRPA